MITYRDIESEENAQRLGRDHVRIQFSEGRGSAFRPIGSDKVYLQRCPVRNCGRENYMMNVSLGICTWCGFDVKTDAQDVTEIHD